MPYWMVAQVEHLLLHRLGSDGVAVCGDWVVFVCG